MKDKNKWLIIALSIAVIIIIFLSWKLWDLNNKTDEYVIDLNEVTAILNKSSQALIEKEKNYCYALKLIDILETYYSYRDYYYTIEGQDEEIKMSSCPLNTACTRHENNESKYISKKQLRDWVDTEILKCPVEKPEIK